MTTAERERLATALRPRLTRYVPHPPHPKQQAGLLLNAVPEMLYGGAAGGGKSDYLLMGALQYVDQPKYSALLLRRTYQELSMEGGLMERAEDWLSPTDAVWHAQDKCWEFPHGAVLQFGYLEGQRDHLRYQGSNWDFIGFDELTQFREQQYRYLFSRLRRLEGSRIPTRMRATSNPGGPGHDWVKQRFGIYRLDGEPVELPYIGHRPDWVRANGRVFLPASLRDNPSLDQAGYVRALHELSPTERRQLLDGDWGARTPGDMFRREWFEVIDRAPETGDVVRYWDLAGTEPHAGNPDPDYTVGLRMRRAENGMWFVEHVARVRRRSHDVEQLVKHTASVDGSDVTIWIEQEPGQSGKSQIEHYQREVLPGYEVRGNAVDKAKDVRARPIASKAEAGLVKLVRGPWVGEFLDEVEVFPSDETHDDQVDAFSGAASKLAADPGPPEAGPTVWS